MWSPSAPPTATPIDGAKIRPLEILYEYDGPTIFVAKIGFFDVIFHKFDETPEHEFFIVAQTNPKTVEALREGRLSMRGALEGDTYWIAQTAAHLEIVRTWRVDEYDLPTRILPTRHHGLLHQLNPVPDTLEQATSFFSVKFNGPALSRQSISFRKMQSLLGEVYDVANNYLLPSVSRVSKYSITDFELAPLKFASLLVSIRRPVVLEDAIRRRNLNVSPAEGLLGQMQQQRDDLIDGMAEVVDEAQRRELSLGFAGEHVTWIAALNTLAPSRGDDVEFVEVAAGDTQSAKMLIINAETAARIKAAHSEVARSIVRLRGKVVEVNASASTFVFKANNVRQTTCVVDPETFERMISNGELAVGAEIEAAGQFERRARRDMLNASEVFVID